MNVKELKEALSQFGNDDEKVYVNDQKAWSCPVNIDYVSYEEHQVTGRLIPSIIIHTANT